MQFHSRRLYNRYNNFSLRFQNANVRQFLLLILTQGDFKYCTHFLCFTGVYTGWGFENVHLDQIFVK